MVCMLVVRATAWCMISMLDHSFLMFYRYVRVPRFLLVMNNHIMGKKASS